MLNLYLHNVYFNSPQSSHSINRGTDICQLQDLILRVSQNTHYAINKLLTHNYAITKFLLNCSLPITCLRVISHLHIFTDDILDKFTLF